MPALTYDSILIIGDICLFLWVTVCDDDGVSIVEKYWLGSWAWPIIQPSQLCVTVCVSKGRRSSGSDLLSCMKKRLIIPHGMDIASGVIIQQWSEALHCDLPHPSHQCLSLNKNSNTGKKRSQWGSEEAGQAGRRRQKQPCLACIVYCLVKTGSGRLRHLFLLLPSCLPPFPTALPACFLPRQLAWKVRQWSPPLYYLLSQHVPYLPTTNNVLTMMKRKRNNLKRKAFALFVHTHRLSIRHGHVCCGREGPMEGGGGGNRANDSMAGNPAYPALTHMPACSLPLPMKSWGQIWEEERTELFPQQSRKILHMPCFYYCLLTTHTCSAVALFHSDNIFIHFCTHAFSSQWRQRKDTSPNHSSWEKNIFFFGLPLPFPSTPLEIGGDWKEGEEGEDWKEEGGGKLAYLFMTQLTSWQAPSSPSPPCFFHQMPLALPFLHTIKRKSSSGHHSSQPLTSSSPPPVWWYAQTFLDDMVCLCNVSTTVWVGGRISPSPTLCEMFLVRLEACVMCPALPCMPMLRLPAVAVTMCGQCDMLNPTPVTCEAVHAQLWHGLTYSVSCGLTLGRRDGEEVAVSLPTFRTSLTWRALDNACAPASILGRGTVWGNSIQLKPRQWEEKLKMWRAYIGNSQYWLGRKYVKPVCGKLEEKWVWACMQALTCNICDGSVVCPYLFSKPF